jgi:hypothetical protein
MRLKKATVTYEYNETTEITGSLWTMDYGNGNVAACGTFKVIISGQEKFSWKVPFDFWALAKICG